MTSFSFNVLRARALRCARRTLRAASVPLVVAIQPLAPSINRRTTYARSTPTASEVIANYTRGLVLFGRPGARRVKFEWRSFPMRAVITKETARIPKLSAAFSGAVRWRFDLIRISRR